MKNILLAVSIIFIQIKDGHGQTQIIFDEKEYKNFRDKIDTANDSTIVKVY